MPVCDTNSCPRRHREYKLYKGVLGTPHLGNNIVAIVSTIKNYKNPNFFNLYKFCILLSNHDKNM